MVLDVILFMIFMNHALLRIQMIQQCDDIPIYELIHLYKSQRLGMYIEIEVED